MAFTTRKNLLNALKRNENVAWEQFLDFYGPLIALRAKDFGLTPLELEELRQDTCVSIFTKNSIDAYNPSKGRFRDYLRGILTHRALDILGRRAPLVDPRPGLPTEEDDSKRFEQEWREFVFEKALKEVQERCDDLTFMAFQLHAMHGRPAKEVAQELKISEQKVFLSSSRITQRLKEAVKNLEKELDE